MDLNGKFYGILRDLPRAIKTKAQSWDKMLNQFTYVYSRTTGQPVDDPKGRYRIGGGVNVPVEAYIQAEKAKVLMLRRELTLIGIRATLL